MDLRRLLAATGIVCIGLAMLVATARLPSGNEDIEVVCGFFGMLLAGIGLLHPFKLGWKAPALAFLGLIALGVLFPLLTVLFG